MESLPAELISQLVVNRSQLLDLQQGIEKFSKLFEKDEVEIFDVAQQNEVNNTVLENELLNCKEELNFTKQRLVEYEKVVAELRSQVLEQEELLQEHEEATTTLMHSFRNRAKELTTQFETFKNKYNSQIEQEQRANYNLREENGRLRELLSKLTRAVMEEEGLDKDDEDKETEWQMQENTRLSLENEGLRKLLQIHLP